MSLTDLSAYRRRVVIVTETPESKQPYSMMHRALYANIVGQDTFYGFPHGCTIKQLDGEDYIVDHVTRLAQPVSKIPALNPDSKASAKTAAELINGIIKCESVLRNLETRAKMAQTQLATSSQNSARHEATIKNVQSTALTLHPPAPIANVITQRSNELVTVRSLLSLVAQAMRAASTVAVRDLKPHQLAELQKIAPALHAKYTAWKSGELKLLERDEEEALKRQARETVPSEATNKGPEEAETDNPNTDIIEDATKHEDWAEGHGDTYEDEDTLPGDEENSSDESEGPKPPEMTEESEKLADPDMDDDIPMPIRNPPPSDRQDSKVAPSDEPQKSEPQDLAVNSEEQPLQEDAMPSVVVDEPFTTSTIEEPHLGEEIIPQSQPLEDLTAHEATESSNHVPEQEVSEPTSTGAVEIINDSVAETPTPVRESCLSLPECNQPNIVILCVPCKAFIAFDSDSLDKHDNSVSHRVAIAHKTSSSNCFTSELSDPPTELPSFVSSRPVPKRHVRVTDDNTFLEHYSVVRTGCSSCQKDVAVSDMDSHATTEEHLDFLEEN